MTITISAFERSPDGGKGLARDTRVRWALEEAGLPYQVRFVSFRALKLSGKKGRTGVSSSEARSRNTRGSTSGRRTCRVS